MTHSMRLKFPTLNPYLNMFKDSVCVQSKRDQSVLF
ncbi:erythromycin resistance leader peptide [Sporolactobacillus sp. Y61]|uniref:Erythromycin resistance leader peptide n=1 Tax=Sporolactobacillus sp. Y61 TaxID=3160863 RepID=A0AAU8IF64_9BACL|nr:hypothetical protein EWH91_13970 [Sporolactobacillus sp. THM19-2]